MNYYFHHVPGRLRVKIPLITDHVIGQNVEALIKDHLGIESVTINSLTGSVLVYYDINKVNVDSILNRLERNGYFDKSKAQIANHRLRPFFSKAGRPFGKALFSWAVCMALEEADLAFLAALI